MGQLNDEVRLYHECPRHADVIANAFRAMEREADEKHAKREPFRVPRRPDISRRSE